MIEFALIVAAVVFLIYFLGGRSLEDSLRKGLGCGVNIILFLVLLAVVGILLLYFAG
ncbi:MAG: hypothetical protein RL432_1185 [Bacteroidota bacterium]|jgi:hypothetical protein